MNELELLHEILAELRAIRAAVTPHPLHFTPAVEVQSRPNVDVRELAAAIRQEIERGRDNPMGGGARKVPDRA